MPQLNPGSDPGRCHTLPFQPPYDWAALAGWLGGRAMAGVETVENGCYRRTVALDGHRGWLAVTQTAGEDTLSVQLSGSLEPVAEAVLARVARMADVATDPAPIQAQLGRLAAERPGLRVPGAFDGFQLAVRAILGQQISVKAATSLGCRYAEAFGEPLEAGLPGLTRLTPTPERVAEAGPEAVSALGMPKSRGRAIHALATAVAEGQLSFEPGQDMARAIATMQALPGIGPWTAHYVAMRALGWADAFPHTDLGLYKALNEYDPGKVLALAEAWRPWRAYAAMQLWQRLEDVPDSPYIFL